jgi:hypothetical protein
LESRHLTGLRALHGTHVQFVADARRRFERLPILRRLRELRLPALDSWPHNPGAWFSEGGVKFAHQWDELQSIALPYYGSLELLRQLSEMPFWSRLASIDMPLPGHPGTPQALSILRDRMPESLRKLRLRAASSPDDYSGVDAFFERLAQSPLHALQLDDIPIRAEILGHLLDGTNRWDLRELKLPGCTLSDDHVQIIANSAGVKNLRSLDLSGNDLGVAAAKALFASPYLHSLVHLDLWDTRIGSEGAIALANAEGWDRLRWLDLASAGLDDASARRLLTSANLQNLTHLLLGGTDYPRKIPCDLTPQLATEITSLPHLAGFCFVYSSCSRCQPKARRILKEGTPLAWITIHDEEDERSGPQPWPPLDGEMEMNFEW